MILYAKDWTVLQMGHFGFSYIGLIWLVMLFVPNSFWAKHQPKGYSAERENRILLIFERIGQMAVTCTALVFSDYNVNLSAEVWNVWLIVSFVLMLLYEYWWIRYFRSEKTLRDFYSSFGFIPVAGATLPVAAFFLLGIYGKNLWLLLSAVILGIGHIGIHLEHRKRILNK